MPEGVDGGIELFCRACQHDGVVEIVHGELCDAPFHGRTVGRRQLIGQPIELGEYRQRIVEALADGVLVAAPGDGVVACPIVVSLVGRVEDALCTQQQLRGECLVFVVDVGLEAQAAEDAACEEVSTCSSPDIALAHEVTATDRRDGNRGEGRL